MVHSVSAAVAGEAWAARKKGPATVKREESINESRKTATTVLAENE
jgi:hypothetical protein